MVRSEERDSRSRWWSRWHRDALPNSCYMSDLDAAEWRPGRGIVAFIEVKLPGDQLSDWQEKKFLPDLARLGPPVYLIVVPAEQPGVFTVWRIRSDAHWDDVGVFEEDDFKAWMSKL